MVENLPPVRGLSLADASAAFVRDEGELRPASLRRYGCSLKQVVAVMGADRPLAAIAVADLKAYVAARRGVVSASTVRRDLAALSALFSWAAADDDALVNPVRQLDKKRLRLREGRPRERWLTPDEFQALLHAARHGAKVYRHVIIVAVETGMRKAELLNLTVGEVDLARGRVVLGGARTKTGRGRIVPLTGKARDTLREALAYKASFAARRKAAPDPHVFVSPRTGRRLGHIDRWWWWLKRRHGLHDFRFHDLRHTFASWAVQRGVPERTVMAILGHATPHMTARYAHLNEAVLFEGVRLFEGGA